MSDKMKLILKNINFNGDLSIVNRIERPQVSISQLSYEFEFGKVYHLTSEKHWEMWALSLLVAGAIDTLSIAGLDYVRATGGIWDDSGAYYPNYENFDSDLFTNERGDGRGNPDPTEGFADTFSHYILSDLLDGSLRGNYMEDNMAGWVEDIVCSGDEC